VNHHLPVIEQCFTQATAVLALGASILQFTGRPISPDYRIRVIAISTGVLAFMYFVLFEYFVLSQVDPRVFNPVLRGTGLVTWPVVWMALPILRLRSDRAQILLARDAAILALVQQKTATDEALSVLVTKAENAAP